MISNSIVKVTLTAGLAQAAYDDVVFVTLTNYESASQISRIITFPFPRRNQFPSARELETFPHTRQSEKKEAIREG